MKILMFLLPLLVLFLLGFLITSHPNNIKYKPIPLILLIQFVLAYFLLNTNVPFLLLKRIPHPFPSILKFPQPPLNFLFPPLPNHPQPPFFLTLLLPIIFL
ncbi:Na+ dependent nucleoside transporter N-terminal domain-containing protein, partial [Bacillus thuringiensis]|uniref:Na+ dependent nucleoside transporter N-terminal domain-containing protein n=1 Tax=Bacillus thuringiensis TaxID=1428 RepID=UPI002413F5CA